MEHIQSAPTVDYDRIAQEYARHRQVHPGVLQSLCQAMQSLSGARARVLEVGCGTGNYILALHALLRCACWGIDPSAEMLAVARREGWQGKERREGKEGREGGKAEAVQFLPGQAEHLGFPPETFDLVFSVDVIHHVGDHARYLCEAYRALKTGGQVCTVTDSEWVIRHRQPLATYFPETVEVELARYPRIAVLREMMAQAGFGEITEDTVEHPYPLTDIQAYRDKAYSALHLISEEAFQKGIARMERDLCVGPIPCVSRYILLWGKK